MEDAQARLREQARAAWESEQWQVSASLYERLLALRPDDPDSAAWSYDAALAYKFLRDWPKARELGIQAAARAEAGTGDPAFWNLGIAATIQRDWETARAAWTGYGITLPPGEGEIAGDFGLTCVRLDAGGGRREVVWARRICPARARVTSVPFGDRRYGEIVVHDGAPNGERLVQGRRYPVFDELLLWQPSQTPAFRVQLSCPSPEDVEALWEQLDALGLTLEATTSLVLHPREQSEGRIELAQQPAAGDDHDVLIPAPDKATVRRLLDTWVAAGPGRAASDPQEKGSGAPMPWPSHSAAEPHEIVRFVDWPFPGGVFPENLGAVAHRSLLEADAAPCRVVHDADGGWQVLDGVTPAEAEHAVVVCMRCLIEQHPEIAELADLPPGRAAERDAPGGPWRWTGAPSEQAD